MTRESCPLASRPALISTAGESSTPDLTACPSHRSATGLYDQVRAARDASATALASSYGRARTQPAPVRRAAGSRPHAAPHDVGHHPRSFVQLHQGDGLGPAGVGGRRRIAGWRTHPQARQEKVTGGQIREKEPAADGNGGRSACDAESHGAYCGRRLSHAPRQSWPSNPSVMAGRRIEDGTSAAAAYLRHDALSRLGSVRQARLTPFSDGYSGGYVQINAQ
jgi:hypothetical protein